MESWGTLESSFTPHDEIFLWVLFAITKAGQKSKKLRNKYSILASSLIPIWTIDSYNKNVRQQTKNWLLFNWKLWKRKTEPQRFSWPKY